MEEKEKGVTKESKCRAFGSVSISFQKRTP